MALKNTFLTVAFLSLLLLVSCKNSDRSYSYYSDINSSGGSVGNNNCCGCNSDRSTTCASLLTVQTSRGIPIEGALVTFFNITSKTYITDENGQTNLIGLKDGSYVVTAVANGYPTALETFTVEDGVCPVLSLTLDSAETCDATFAVIVRNVLQGILPAVIHINELDADFYTDENGQAIIPGLENGTYTYVASLVSDPEKSYSGSYTVTDLDCTSVLICPVVFHLLSEKNVSYENMRLDITFGVGDIRTFYTNINGRVIFQGGLASGDYDYVASWTNESATGTYNMPDSGECPVNPYEIHLSQSGQ